MIKRFFLSISYLSILSLGSWAQSISGNVVNNCNMPIANALIMLENNNAIFTKTNSTGNFTIAGTVNSKLFVSALGFETKKALNITSTTANKIILGVDPIIDLGDVYHISFDHMRPGPSFTETELKKDFPTANGIGFV